MDITSWEIKDNTVIFIDDKGGSSAFKVNDITAASVTPYIKIILENGENRTCHLNKFVVGQRSGFKECYRNSRQLFLGWLNWQPVLNTCSDQPGNDNETSSLHEVDLSNSKEVLDHSQEASGEHKTVDEKRSNIKVHINNLKEADSSVKLRPINADHVQQLANSMAHSYDQYITLVGMVDNDCDINKLQEPGQGIVHVLGGNHTRAALELLQTMDLINPEKQYKYVRMDLYKNLTTEQALFLAYRHNDIHEHSRAMTFQEKVVFFHRMWIKKNVEMNEKPLKVRAISWRSEIALHTNKTKEEVKNCYKVHLSLASCKSDVWTAIEGAFGAFERKEIKGQKTSDSLTQYTFSSFYRVKDDNQRVSILNRLSSGDITLEEFRKLCASDITHIETDTVNGTKGSSTSACSVSDRKKSKKKTDMKEQSENMLKDPSHNKDTYVDHLQMLRAEESKRKVVEQQLEALKKTKVDLMQQINILTNTNQRHLSEYKDATEKLKQKIRQQELMLKAKSVTEQKLQKELDTMKCRAEIAEETAARARAIMSDKAKQVPKTTKTVTSQCKKKPATDHAESHDITEPKKKKSCSEPEFPTPTENKDCDMQKVDVAMVEYTNNKIYMGCLNGTKMTFAKVPVTKKENKLTFAEKCLQINQRDEQEIDTNYIVAKIKCHVKNNLIIITDTEKQYLFDAFNSYVNKPFE